MATTGAVQRKTPNYIEKDNTQSYTPSGDYNPSTKKYADDLDAQAVHKTGDETIAGTKTFNGILKVGNLIIQDTNPSDPNAGFIDIKLV